MVRVLLLPATRRVATPSVVYYVYGGTTYFLRSPKFYYIRYFNCLAKCLNVAARSAD